jgi:hypothetical protein
VIAFNVKFEVACALDHLIISLLIVIKRLHVVNVLLGLAAITTAAYIHNVNKSKYTKSKA